MQDINKFKPGRDDLETWLNIKNPPEGFEHTLTYFDVNETLEGVIKIEGWVSAEQIEIIYKFFEHLNKQEEIQSNNVTVTQ